MTGRMDAVLGLSYADAGRRESDSAGAAGIFRAMEASALSVQNGKTDLAIRVSVTDRCSLRCVYCMPAEGVSMCGHEDILSFEETAGFVRLLSKYYSISKVRLTGGDPLARRGVLNLVSMLSGQGVKDLAMTTNGQQLERHAACLRSAGLHRVNISLDSLDEDVFRRISRGGELSRTLKGIDAAIEAGLKPVKLNMVVMRGVNDNEVCRALSFAMDLGCEIRFLELMPIGCRDTQSSDMFVPGNEIMDRLEGKFRLEPVPNGPSSTAIRYRAVCLENNKEGYAGFITSCSSPFCSCCNRLRITARGDLVGCLARSAKINIRSLMRGADEDGVVNAVREALGSKRNDQCFEQEASMSAIGG